MRHPISAISFLLGVAAKYCLAATPIVAVYQIEEYPTPGKDPSIPSGLVFEVCTDGTFFRSSFGEAAASTFPEQGALSTRTLERLEADLEKKWLSPLRTECEEQRVPLHTASLRIEVGLGGQEFWCSLYKPGDALKQFESMVAGLAEQTSRPAAPRIKSSCK